MSRTNEEIGEPAQHAETGDWKRRHLSQVIDSHEAEILRGIRLYVWKFGLVDDRISLDAIAREILQDTVVTALERADNYDPNRPAQSWLLGIAINHIRHRRRQPPYQITPVSESSNIRQLTQRLDLYASDNQDISIDEMIDLLYQATKKTNPHGMTFNELLSLVHEGDQQVLRLAFDGNLRGRQLAAALGISEGAAWARLSRAVTRLRNVYLESDSGK